MNSLLTKIEETELSMLTSILEDGRSSEELFFVGEAKDQANMILSSMKGAILYAQGQGLDFYKRTMNQVVANLKDFQAPETSRIIGSSKEPTPQPDWLSQLGNLSTC